MLDIHSHILPKFDDGSKSVEMSQEMLRASKEQGVTTIVSTSHFYADSENPEHFLKRRRHAAEKVSPLAEELGLKLYYGAEVLYFPGIAQSEAVRELAIEGTSLILIEMPFISWSEKIFDELQTLCYNSGLHIVLAHIERYRGIQTRAIFDKLLEQPFYFQMNAEAFSSFATRRLAMKLIERDSLHFLGTDCHNITSRPPNMQVARQAIEKRLSPAAWKTITREAEERFRQHII